MRDVGSNGEPLSDESYYCISIADGRVRILRTRHHIDLDIPLEYAPFLLLIQYEAFSALFRVASLAVGSHFPIGEL